MSGHEHDRAHQHDHDHHHDREHDYGHEHRGIWARLRHAVGPHSHDHDRAVDSVLESSAEGLRTLWISLAGLAATALAQAVVVALSGSVALLGDTLHNAADALTAVPLGVAFLLSRRRPTRRYTYGYGRAEDLAGIVIVAVIVLSSAAAAYAAIGRLLHPHQVTHLAAVAIAAAVGFAGNELVARYRIRTGRRIGSAALVADGLHRNPGARHRGQRRARADPRRPQAHGRQRACRPAGQRRPPRRARAPRKRLDPGQDPGQQGTHPAGRGPARLDHFGVAEALPGQARRHRRPHPVHHRGRGQPLVQVDPAEEHQDPYCSGGCRTDRRRVPRHGRSGEPA